MCTMCSLQCKSRNDFALPFLTYNEPLLHYQPTAVIKLKSISPLLPLPTPIILITTTLKQPPLYNYQRQNSFPKLCYHLCSVSDIRNPQNPIPIRYNGYMLSFNSTLLKCFPFLFLQNRKPLEN